MPVKTYMQAITEATIEEMERDPAVFTMGEDLRKSVYGATAGLVEQFGEDRVIDTPLSENGFFGAALGASLCGMRPIVETVTSFLWVGMDQLVSQGSKMRYMFGGQAELPVTFRVRMFYARGAAAHHSDRNYPSFMNTPGLKIICPSNAYDAKGLLKTAVRDNDVCLIFEDGIAISSRTEVPDNEDLPGGELLIPFGEANTVRPGTDVTVVGIAGGVQHALDAAQAMEAEGVSCEVIDPRTLVPLDSDAILKSVARTGRLVIVDPAHKMCSAASEIAAIVAQEGFWDLQAPIQIVAAEQINVPYSPALEPLIYPTPEKVIEAITTVID
ncbi:MAG TPA: transketolase C-terminal domain-containing protein [Dehalococcoidia bacterium]|jgi:pyruvate dehydrogenase E1 component beta subunit|nr:alpha-ketoacid dehydrogenase subunit beta [Chloroflexota bacterium]MDP6056837.1 transketolase C-terminal domain-containing protein [Dehalococcoidia bacterium]MDP7261804.1 transketolase C-terminal domain-containing protein [Dehalococcoidia bacterium]MDP7486053.1 transketolase C-terminal domain-containing protein [Dehalococcoidia bacterium]HJP28417.1 transketolase C-terminal domain-containing protein [Dehalococcoidia bacterium]|tara:strand:- start:5530 stop:6513 length:984 start_codon:yes stop_codon:yes gene_type:complete